MADPAEEPEEKLKDSSKTLRPNLKLPWEWLFWHFAPFGRRHRLQKQGHHLDHYLVGDFRCIHCRVLLKGVTQEQTTKLPLHEARCYFGWPIGPIEFLASLRGKGVNCLIEMMAHDHSTPVIVFPRESHSRKEQ